MDNYKITTPKQIDALLDYLVRVYAREVVNTNLLIRLISKENEVLERELIDEVSRDLVSLNNEIRESIYVEYGYLDPNSFSK